RERVTGAQGRFDRQPRLALLPGDVLGPGTGEAGRRPGARRRVQGTGRDAHPERADHQRRAHRGAGPSGRSRRGLATRPGEGRGRDAALADVQRCTALALMVFLVLFLLLVAGLSVWALIDPQGAWRASQGRMFRDPSSVRLSSVGATVQRVVAVVVL